LLNNLRDALEPSLTKLGKSFASAGLSANFWTGLGLAVSIIAAIAYSSGTFINVDWTPWSFVSVMGGILILFSGFCDIIDGSIARVTNQTTKKGAFLDSSFDKIAEIVLFAGIAYGKLADPLLCLIGLGMSLLVSYTRARAESLGAKLKGVGIGERAERMLIIAIIGMIPVREAMDCAIIIVSIVAGITSVQRIAASAKKLSSI
jgi:archaetidylinositol phosphate synthase